MARTTLPTEVKRATGKVAAILDAEGNPVLDEDGKPTFHPETFDNCNVYEVELPPGTPAFALFVNGRFMTRGIDYTYAQATRVVDFGRSLIDQDALLVAVDMNTGNTFWAWSLSKGRII